MPEANGDYTTYTYDAVNRLKTLTNPDDQVTTYTYDNVGNITKVELDNGSYTDYAYNNANWITSVTNKKSDNSTISSFTYLYDNAGNRTRMTEANGDYTSWTYDTTYQLLTDVKKTSGDTTIYSYTYTYDDVGNRLTRTDKDNVITTYTYDSANKLLTTNTGGSITTYTYDSNGNQRTTQDATGITTFTYNCENKLTQITYPDTSTNTFTYNADGKRRGKTDSSGTRKYLYDEQKYDIIMEKDQANTTKAVYALGMGLISQKRDTTYSYYLYDALGSTRNLNSSAETTTDTYTYEAFGNIESSSGTTVNPFRYVGKEGYYLDTDSDLMLLRERYYDAKIGRFITRDPIGLGQGSYPYIVWANPVRFTDPLGLDWACLSVSTPIGPSFGVVGFSIGGEICVQRFKCPHHEVRCKKPHISYTYPLCLRAELEGSFGVSLIDVRKLRDFFENWRKLRNIVGNLTDNAIVTVLSLSQGRYGYGGEKCPGRYVKGQLCAGACLLVYSVEYCCTLFGTSGQKRCGPLKHGWKGCWPPSISGGFRFEACPE